MRKVTQPVVVLTCDRCGAEAPLGTDPFISPPTMAETVHLRAERHQVVSLTVPVATSFPGAPADAGDDSGVDLCRICATDLVNFMRVSPDRRQKAAVTEERPGASATAASRVAKP